MRTLFPEQSRQNQTWWQPLDEAADQSAKRILRGSRLPSRLRQRLTPNRIQVLLMPVTRLQWRKPTRKPTRKRRNPETDVGDSEEDIDFREVVSGPVESTYFSIILGAVPVVVLELCERCSDSVRVNMFGLAQRVHIPSLRTAHHAALAPLARTAPNKLDSREGCLHRRRVLLENLELCSEPMLKDMKTLTQKDPEDMSFPYNRWYLRIRSESVIHDTDHLLVLLNKQLYRDLELTVSNEPVKHTIVLTELHEDLKSSEWFDGNLTQSRYHRKSNLGSQLSHRMRCWMSQLQW